MTTTAGRAAGRALRAFGRRHKALAYCWAVGWLAVVPLLALPVALLAWFRRGAVVDSGRPGDGWLHVASRVAGAYRRLPSRWGGTPIPSPYLRDRPRREDPAHRRDLQFLALEPLVAAVVLLLPGAMAWYAVFGLLAPGIAAFFGGDGGALIRAVLPGEPELGLPLGLVAYVGVLLLSGPASRLHAVWWLPRLLVPAPSVAAEVERRRLAERVEELQETRTAAVDSREAELRRIERDLHDGAQARLVAMGLALGTVEVLMDSDPEKARALVKQARESSSRALVELRALVRGIHPPVLAERGLVDALRALALDAPLEAEVDAERLTGRPEAPIEAALYFAVAELLTNAARHGEAGHARVELSHAGGVLRCAVRDDGGGGAHEEDGPMVGAGGSGLRGVRRRLAAFDGTLAIDSPAGGPTVVVMELPCVVSAAKEGAAPGAAQESARESAPGSAAGSAVEKGSATS